MLCKLSTSPPFRLSYEQCPDSGQRGLTRARPRQDSPEAHNRHVHHLSVRGLRVRRQDVQSLRRRSSRGLWSIEVHSERCNSCAEETTHHAQAHHHQFCGSHKLLPGRHLADGLCSSLSLRLAERFRGSVLRVELLESKPTCPIVQTLLKLRSAATATRPLRLLLVAEVHLPGLCEIWRLPVHIEGVEQAL